MSEASGFQPFDLQAPIKPLIPRQAAILRDWIDCQRRQVAHPTKGAWWLGIWPTPEPEPKPSALTEEENVLAEAMSTVDFGDAYSDLRSYDELAPEFIEALAALGWRLARTDMYAFMNDGPRRVWYRAFTPDGELWNESSNPDDFGTVEPEGGEDPEELAWIERRNATLATCRFEKASVYEVSKVEEWKPW